MESEARPSPSTGTWIFLVLAAVISVVNAIDFLFYGRELRALLACVGFALMGYGTWRNGFRVERQGARAHVPLDPRARYANIAGIVLVLGSFALRFMD